MILVLVFWFGFFLIFFLSFFFFLFPTKVLTWGKDESELVVWESDKLRDLSTQTLDRLPKVT